MSFSQCFSYPLLKFYEILLSLHALAATSKSEFYAGLLILMMGPSSPGPQGVRRAVNIRSIREKNGSESIFVGKGYRMFPILALTQKSASSPHVSASPSAAGGT